MSLRASLPLLLITLAGCGQGDSPSSAFTDGEASVSEDSKADTGYVTSLDAAEVEVDLEGDVQAAASDIDRAPLSVGQFALTWLRKNQNVYIQSMAEDYSHGTDKVEWLVNGAWTMVAAIPTVDRAKLSHFRMRGVSAVIRHPGDRTKLLGKAYTPVVPRNPDTLFGAVGTKCGQKEGDIDVEDGVYWYVWAPEKTGCPATAKQNLSVKVSKVLPRGALVYPEYDKLLADKKLDVLVLFGQVDHGTLSSSDYAFSLISDFEDSIKVAGFSKAASAPKGLRYIRTRRGVTTTIDIYGPREFAGLDDWAHISNFDEGVRGHEIIVYNGHSMLGASDFWARPSIYSGAAATKYQIFLYNGCLGYEYYVNPILDGKKSWANVDIVSNIVETPFAIMVDETANTLGKIVSGAEKGGTASWQNILKGMNDIAGEESFYGASGVRTNSFRPTH